MSEEYRPLILALVAIMMAVVILAVVAHFLIRRAVRDLIAKSSEKQLLADVLSIQKGLPLRPLRGDPSSVNRKLLATLNRV